MSSGTSSLHRRGRKENMERIRQGLLDWNEDYDVLTDEELKQLAERIENSMYPQRKTAATIAKRVDELLDMGNTTEQIAEEMGVLYSSIVYSLKRAGNQQETHQRLIALRAREYEERTRYAA